MTSSAKKSDESFRGKAVILPIFSTPPDCEQCVASCRSGTDFGRKSISKPARWNLKVFRRVLDGFLDDRQAIDERESLSRGGFDKTALGDERGLIYSMYRSFLRKKPSFLLFETEPEFFTVC